MRRPAGPVAAPSGQVGLADRGNHGGDGAGVADPGPGPCEFLQSRVRQPLDRAAETVLFLPAPGRDAVQSGLGGDVPWQQEELPSGRESRRGLRHAPCDAGMPCCRAARVVPRLIAARRGGERQRGAFPAEAIQPQLIDGLRRLPAPQRFRADDEFFQPRDEGRARRQEPGQAAGQRMTGLAGGQPGDLLSPPVQLDGADRRVPALGRGGEDRIAQRAQQPEAAFGVAAQEVGDQFLVGTGRELRPVSGCLRHGVRSASFRPRRPPARRNRCSNRGPNPGPAQ